MKFRVLPVLALVFSSQVFAMGPLPKDVADFLARREKCDERRAEMSSMFGPSEETMSYACVYCPGQDETLAALMRKHGGNSDIMSVLKKLDPQIEDADPKERAEMCVGIPHPSQLKKK